MTVVLHRQRIFPVGFLERAWTAVDGDHGELVLCPLLDLFVAKLNGDLPRPFHRHWAMKFLSIDVDRQIGGETFEALGPACGIFKCATERFAGLWIIGYGRLFLGMGVHDEVSLRG